MTIDEGSLLAPIFESDLKFSIVHFQFMLNSPVKEDSSI